MANFYGFYPPSGGGGTNASVGANGQPIPTSSTEMGAEDPSGNLAPLHVDNSGNLLVSLAADPISPLDVNLIKVGGAAVSLNQKTSALSIPVVIASDQSAVAVSAASLPLPSGASTAALQSNVQSAPGTPQTVAITVQGNASAVAVPISAAALPLPSGAATLTAQNTGNASLSSIDGKTPALGQAAMAASVPVAIASNQSSFPVTVAAGTAIIGKVSIDQTTPGTTNGVQVNAALPAGSNVIGHVVTDSGSTTAVTQATASNLNATVVQATGTNLHTVVDSGSITVSGTVAATQSGTWTVQPGNTANTTAWLVAQKGLASSNAPVTNDYSSVNVTTAAYVQLIASTTSATTFIDIFDSSGQAMILATGGAGSEVIQAYIPPGGDAFNFAIPASTRVAIKALTANATSGYILLNLRG